MGNSGDFVDSSYLTGKHLVGFLYLEEGILGELSHEGAALACLNFMQK